MVLMTSRYIKPLDEIDALLVEHRRFLDEQYRNRKFICSGPLKPRIGGVIIADVDSVEEAREIMKQDPFSIHGAAEYQFVEFTPLKYDERFACFIRQE